MPRLALRLEQSTCVTARALAPCRGLLELVSPYFASSTLGLFSKGREARPKSKKQLRKWQFACELKPSLTDEGSSVVLRKALKPKTLQPKAFGPKTEG